MKVRIKMEHKYNITMEKYYCSCIDHCWRHMDYTFRLSRDKNMDSKIRISKINFENWKILKSLKLFKRL